MATCPSILLELPLPQIATFANQILKLQLYLSISIAWWQAQGRKLKGVWRHKAPIFKD